MTNKEFQNLLSQYPDDYNISVNWAFGWEVPSNKYKEDPYIYVNDDCGFIEIEPKEYMDIWIKCSERLPEFINGEENQYYYDTKLQKILTCKWEVSDRVLVMCSNGEIHISVFRTI